MFAQKMVEAPELFAVFPSANIRVDERLSNVSLGCCWVGIDVHFVFIAFEDQMRLPRVYADLRDQ